jgi:hypothetical protein
MTWPPGDFVSSIAAAGDDDDDDAMDVEAPVKRRQFTAPAAAMREVGWQHVALAPNTTFQTTPCSIREHTTQQIFTTQDSDLQHAKQLCQPLFFFFFLFSRLLWSLEIGDHIGLIWSNEKMVVLVKLLLWPYDFNRLMWSNEKMVVFVKLLLWPHDFNRLMWSNEKMVVFVKLLLWPYDFNRLIILLLR